MNHTGPKMQAQKDLRPLHQMRALQFRSIAPKVPSGVSAPAILSCHTPSTPSDATPTVGPKSIVMPAQNYALMQMAGQGGAFSLVALPPSVSPPAPQQQAQKCPSFTKTPKLPIPRYQPAQSRSIPEKVGQAPAVQVQSPTTGAATLNTWPPESLESPSKAESSDQVMLIDSGSSEISVTALLSDSRFLCSSSRVESVAKVDGDLYHTTGETLTSVDKVQEECNQDAPCISKSGAITVLSPAVFSKVVQVIPSLPKGKLPILPYSKMKNSLLPPAKTSAKSAEKGFAGPHCGLANSTSLAHRTPVDTDAVCQKQVPNISQQSQLQAKGTCLPGVGLGTLQKSAGKKRGRKKKTIEDILAFEARKKRSLSFFRRRVPDKLHPVATGPKEKTLDISKKYRSIRPKPVLVLDTVPQLLGLPPHSSTKRLELDLPLGRQLPSNTLDVGDLEPVVERPGAESGYLSARQLHRCPTCSRCFQFKHHLQSHMNSHTNRRPHACPVCRKAYAHSGSLSTHMKLHHAEGRPRRGQSCELCNRVFSYTGVYLSHLREAHKVILTMQPSASQQEEDVPVEGVMPPHSTDEQTQEKEDPTELQIKCSRCHTVEPTFADIKLHLLYVHGEEVQANLREVGTRGCQQAEDELVKHATNERRSRVKCGSCGEEFFSFSKLKRHIYSHHRGEPEVTVEYEEPIGEPAGDMLPPKSVTLQTGDAYHCVLCSASLDSKEELLAHWGGQHNCEDPPSLWTMLSLLVKLDGANLSTEGPSQLGPV
ncbi:zinc finger protein 438-like isoform X2 [Brienomyrus brachyistius]|uniref:zinc finger protein 438-like isoform X2 n=1 Tax=Brienomyrus brachyistius TaxID=42636 RepID=UPI0020B2FC22|nr:zinc finger protein 438-like isoform X2 [Brienomyrus brachyistius]XP_048870409.1 zinc finger protein 438-like isoform X2 [Brienomyrus brachyistius]XP_048870410.1 zinc finger protein 438-like isoform X2 [Brienomyrus brachyistius]XP_048870413.1 zinc finger protein 438-like isoform X2 [Brienomyrus brachyistius]XP_048870421.1 zinc finger protein 438-like isoform X2 [Brienomyrus brachyistius]XP_048870424.1 zinc finger protein 438-like isoform X2 [Brienomyrus brachyistius]XP_048870432.1 zinc fin